MQEGKKVTAKVKVDVVDNMGDQVRLVFSPDYNDDRNKEWAKYTPSLGLTMNVLPEVAEHFDLNDKITLTFEKSED